MRIGDDQLHPAQPPVLIPTIARIYSDLMARSVSR
jgi:hypothetical protein